MKHIFTRSRPDQSSDLAGFALGTGTGWLAHTRDSPVILGVLPHGFVIGLRQQF